MNLHRTVHLFGEINNESIARLTKEIIQFHNDGSEAPIDLLIASGGGGSIPGFAFYDFIRATQIPLRTFTSGDLSSMAVPVFLAGGSRYVGQNTSTTLHEAKANFGNNFLTATQIQTAYREITLRMKNYKRVLVERTKIKSDDLPMMLLQETVLDSEQLIEFGIAHELWVPAEPASA